MFVRNGILNRLINLDRVDSIYEVRDKEHNMRGCMAVMHDGTEHVIAASLEEIEEIQSRFVKAEPGFELLVAWFPSRESDKPMWVDRQPVIAWRIGEYGPQPVVPDIEDYILNQDNNANAVRYPDGRVVKIGSTTWDTEEAWRIAAQESANTYLEEQLKRNTNKKPRRPNLI